MWVNRCLSCGENKALTALRRHNLLNFSTFFVTHMRTILTASHRVQDSFFLFISFQCLVRILWLWLNQRLLLLMFYYLVLFTVLMVLFFTFLTFTCCFNVNNNRHGQENSISPYWGSFLLPDGIPTWIIPLFYQPTINLMHSPQPIRAAGPRNQMTFPQFFADLKTSFLSVLFATLPPPPTTTTTTTNQQLLGFIKPQSLLLTYRLQITPRQATMK